MGDNEEVIRLKINTTDAKRSLDDLKKQAAQGVAVDARVNAANMKSFQQGQKSDATFNAAMVGLEGGGWGGRVGSAFSIGGYAMAAGATAGAALWGLASAQTDIAITKLRAGAQIGATPGSARIAELQASAEIAGNHPFLDQAFGPGVARTANVKARLDQIEGVRDAVAARVDAILGPVASASRSPVDKATVDTVTQQAILEIAALAKQEALDRQVANEHLADISDALGEKKLGDHLRSVDANPGSRQ